MEELYTYPILGKDGNTVLERSGKSLWDALCHIYPTDDGLLPSTETGEGYIIDRAKAVLFFDKVVICLYARTKETKALSVFRYYVNRSKLHQTDLDRFAEHTRKEVPGGGIVLPWESAVDPFEPSDAVNLSDNARLGVLEALADHMMGLAGVRKEPFLCREGQPIYEIVADCLSQTLDAQPKTSKETKMCARCIRDLTMRLHLNETVSDKEGEIDRFYYLTKNYFYHRHQTTALAFYRTKRGMKLEELSEKTGISVRQLYNYENRSPMLTRAKPYIIKALADALGVEQEELILNGKAVLVYPV